MAGYRVIIIRLVYVIMASYYQNVLRLYNPIDMISVIECDSIHVLDNIRKEIKMSSWMNFIGKGYYTIPKFIEESKLYGITRRIALLPLMAMNWDDRVLCVQQESNIQAHSAFLEFPITKLVGLTPQAIEAVSGLVTIKKVVDIMVCVNEAN